MSKAEFREKLDGDISGGPADIRLWLRLLSCSTIIEKRLRRKLAERSSTLPRFDVMAALVRYPEGLTMSALSRQLFVSNGNITHLVRWLVKEDLVAIEQCSRDGRSTITRLTPKGADTFAVLSREHHQWVEAMFAGLGTDDKEGLFVSLGKLRASVEESSEENVRAA
ncbi:MarR family transcriptional regulator [Sphingomonas sp.]|uniref:MarR family winged helix-turn-helix transcriptional regulator n=1 Tax=Sphingomonas sp. TaxID=28214 RepID=UPI0025E24F04|nr:MarR family transcriptional regulator [Sphingomonas sp.]